MEDARSKLLQGIAQKKAGEVKSPPKAPAKAPTRSAPPPAKKSSTPAKSAAKASPKKPKAKKPKVKKPKAKKPKAPKPKKGSGANPLKMFANHLLDELKDATSEIKPKALLGHAADSLQSIKSMVGLDEVPEPPARQNRSDSVQDSEQDAPFDPEAGEAASPPATERNWTLSRRRIRFNPTAPRKNPPPCPEKRRRIGP